MDRYQPFPIDPSWQQNFQPMEFVQNNPELISGDHWQKPDRERMAIYRYQRLQQEIIRYDCAGALLFSPMNVRYATETIYAPITNMHSPTRSVFVPNQGSATLYDSAVDILDWLPNFIGECRQSPVTAYFIAGDSYADSSRRFA